MVFERANRAQSSKWSPAYYLTVSSIHSIVITTLNICKRVLRELSVCLWKWNHQLDRVVASFSVRAWGCCFQRWLICPSTEVGDDIVKGCLFVSLVFSGLLPVLALLSSCSLGTLMYEQRVSC
jgi:hypothetical protein